VVDLAELLNIPRIYERSLCRYLEKDSGVTGLSRVQHGSVIACTSRSGSTLLQACLEQYGIDPQEWLNPEYMIKPVVQQGNVSTLTEYGDHLAQTVTNGRFDLKGTIAALLFLFQLHELPERTDVWRFVFLRRRNVVRQAISARIAVRTGQWTDAWPQQRQVTDEDYSFDEISGAVLGIVQQNANLEKAFAVLGIDPFRIYYEDFVQDITGNTWEIARYLGLDVPPEPIEFEPRIGRQSTGTNGRWEARFVEEMDTALRKR
jgi:trehalose 2-sulfotransferase